MNVRPRPRPPFALYNALTTPIVVVERDTGEAIFLNHATHTHFALTGPSSPADPSTDEQHWDEILTQLGLTREQVHPPAVVAADTTTGGGVDAMARGIMSDASGDLSPPTNPSLCIPSSVGAWSLRGVALEIPGRDCWLWELLPWSPPPAPSHLLSSASHSPSSSPEATTPRGGAPSGGKEGEERAATLGWSRPALSALPVPVAVVDRHCTVQYANRAFRTTPHLRARIVRCEALLHLLATQPGRHVQEVQLQWNVGDDAAHHRHPARTTTTPTEPREKYTYTLQVRRLDAGSEPESAGVGPYYLLLALDVSSSQRTRGQLQSALKRITTTADFISNLAHEIRTPLNGILGMLQFLHSSTLTMEQQSCLHTAVNSTFALSHLLNDVLDLSKVEAGELAVDLVPTSVRRLSRLMEDLAQLYGNAVAGKGLRLYIDYPVDCVFHHSPAHRNDFWAEGIGELSCGASHRETSVPRGSFRRSRSEAKLRMPSVRSERDILPLYLYTDIMRVRQVLVNLISNAVKYTHRGHIRVQLRLYSTQSDNPFQRAYPVQIEVSDSGEGISDVDLRNVFSRFKRFRGTDPDTEEANQRPEGTGIGLSIVKAISERLGGHIVLESELGLGSSFTLCLPFCPTPATFHSELRRSSAPSIQSKSAVKMSFTPAVEMGTPEPYDSPSLVHSSSGEALPNLCEMQSSLSKRTIVVLSPCGPDLLGDGTISFLRESLDTCCLFFDSLEDFHVSPPPITRTRHASVPALFPEEGEGEGEGDRRRTCLEDLLSPSLPLSSSPSPSSSVLVRRRAGSYLSRSALDADIIVLDSSTFYDESLGTAEKVGLEEHVEPSSSPAAAAASSLDRSLTKEQMAWIQTMCEMVQRLYRHVWRNHQPPHFQPPPYEGTTAQVRHPRSFGSLFLVIPAHRIPIVSVLCESGLPWFTGWLPSPFLPSRFFRTVFHSQLPVDTVPSPLFVAPPGDNLLRTSLGDNNPLGPMGDLHSPATGPDALASSPLSGSGSRGSVEYHYHLLVVEDNMMNRLVAQKLITQLRRDIKIEMAVNGHEAVQKYRESLQSVGARRYDLCLMDLQMPILNGHEAAQQIRVVERELNTPVRLPILALTASAPESVKQECLASGMDHVLSKPLLKVDLDDALTFYLPPLK